jgi:hypothetical protein
MHALSLLRLAALLAILCSAASAQSDRWLPPTGPYGGRISDMAAAPNGMHVAVTTQATYGTTNGGIRWDKLVDGAVRHVEGTATGALVGANRMGLLRWDASRGQWITTLRTDHEVDELVASRGGMIYAVDDNRFFRSSDDGLTWEIDTLESALPTRLAVTTSGAIVASSTGLPNIQRSLDSGRTWSGAPFPNAILDIIATPDGAVFVATFDGVRRSTDVGVIWTDASEGIGDVIVSSLAVSETGRLYAVCDSGLARWDVAAERWDLIRQSTASLEDGDLYATRGDTLFVGLADGLVRSVDMGATWTWTVDGIIESHATSLVTMSTGEIFASTATSLFRSTDIGATWQRLPLYGAPPSAFVTPEGALVAATNDGFARSTDRGDTWTRFRMREHSFVRGYASGSDGTLYGYSAGPLRFVRSNDDGRTWIDLTASLIGGGTPTSMAVTPNGVLTIGTDKQHMIRSSDRGATFRHTPQQTYGWPYASVALANNDVIFGTTEGWVIRLDEDDNYTELGPRQFNRVETLLLRGNTLFAGAYSVFRWDLGADTTWRRFSDGLVAKPVYHLASHPDGYLFASFLSGGVARTSSIVAAAHDARRGEEIAMSSTHDRASNELAVRFALERPSTAVITLRTMTGEEVARVDAGAVEAGDRRIVVPVEGLASGAYLVELRAGGRRATGAVYVVQ